MSPAAWGFLGAVAGPALLFVTWAASRRQQKASVAAEAMAATTTAALATTETMRLLIAPLEREISALRGEVRQLRFHITVLEGQIRDMGAEPRPPITTTSDTSGRREDQ